MAQERLTLTSLLVNPEIEAYHLIYQLSKGRDPIAQYWALNKLFESLTLVTNLTADLLLKRIKPLNKTEAHLVSNQISKNYHKEDLIQDINLSILHVLKLHKIKNTNRFYDYFYLVTRQMFRNYGDSIRKEDSEDE